MRRFGIVAATATVYAFGCVSGWLANNLTRPVQWAGKLTEDAPAAVRSVLPIQGWSR